METYGETLDYLYGLEKFGIVFGLDNITWILELLGNPHEGQRAIHIAGTNGKGSVSAMLAGILRAGGVRTGVYTSPHLVSFTERIVVNEEPITEEEVVDLTRFIRERIEKADPARHFTFFDFTTALAFEYFKRKAVQAAVIEVGLGGRLDSTNVIKPLVTMITNVDFDHQEYLGNTIEEIAREKAGVIKDHVPVVTGCRGTALEIIRQAAAATDLYVLGEAFTYKKQDEQAMWYRGMRRTFDRLTLGLRGDHQMFNAALALCAVELLNEAGFTLGEAAVRQGLATVQWPGRLELIQRPGKPLILLDGAHNPAGVKTLAEYLGTHFLHKRRILIFGVMKDKAFGEMLPELVPLVGKVILTRPEVDRAALPDEVAPYAPGALVTSSLKEALAEGFKIARENDLLVVTGSFYTVGEARKLLDEER